MPTREYCSTLGCWRPNHHQGDHGGQTPPTRLLCICQDPIPTPSDMCARCLRVIANLIHQRRQTR